MHRQQIGEIVDLHYMSRFSDSGRDWATHGVGYQRRPDLDGAGVPWVLTGTHERDPPSQRDDGDIRDVTRTTFQQTPSAVNACRELLRQVLIVLSTCSSTTFDSSATVCTSSCASSRCLNSRSPFCHIKPTSLANLFASSETCMRSPNKFCDSSVACSNDGM